MKTGILGEFEHPLIFVKFACHVFIHAKSFVFVLAYLQGHLICDNQKKKERRGKNKQANKQIGEQNTLLSAFELTASIYLTTLPNWSLMLDG